MRYLVDRLGSKTRTAIVLVSILLAGVCTAFGEVSAGPLTPSKVFINDSFQQLDLQEFSSPTAAFRSTKITCPAKHTKGCTIRVETTIEVQDIPSGGVMLEYFLRNGGMLDIAELEESTDIHTASRRTVVFVIFNVQAGSTETIDVQLQNLFGTAHAGLRIETIELLLN